MEGGYGKQTSLPCTIHYPLKQGVDLGLPASEKKYPVQIFFTPIFFTRRRPRPAGKRKKNIQYKFFSPRHFSPGGDLGLPASEKKISSANFFHPDIVKFFTRPDLGLPVKRQSIFSPPYINHSPKLNFFFLHLRDFFYPLKGPENFDENTVFFEKMKVGPRIV